jgi:thioredoxin-dependent peroxiredoxin
MPNVKLRLVVALAAALFFLPSFSSFAAESEPRSKPLEVGDKADDFKLQTLGDEEFVLSEHLKEGPIVLLVLRGYPGYQCPICSRQVGDYLAHADKFADLNAQVVMVYPGPSEELQARAKEFLRERTLPENFHFLLDPDYGFTNQYALRWDEPRETSYPSTFVLDQEGNVKLAVVSHSHGGRTKANDALEALGKTPKE